MMKNYTEERMSTQLAEAKEHTLRTGHISRDLFCDWQEGRLKGREETDFFTHIGACTFCAEQFGNWMEEGLSDEMGREQFLTMEEEPPRYLKEEIRNRTRQLDVQASMKLKETSRQVQLMLYSLKVGLAVAASIFLLTITSNIQNMGIDQELPERQWMEEKQDEKERPEREESIAGKLRRGSREITAILNEFSSGLFRVDMNTSENKRNQEVTR
ncbi:MAG: hypothetical protein HFH49_17950 [Lachnospiraceae bacterium]|nr:hypothetical protein [Lachnospiraceae bacterium]